MIGELSVRAATKLSQRENCSSSFIPNNPCKMGNDPLWKRLPKRSNSANALIRHKELLNCYKSLNFFKDKPLTKTDIDIIRENFLFDFEDEDLSDEIWQHRLIKAYHSKLFKEFCIVKFSNHQTKRLALRWRSEDEVLNGKGQYICGNGECSVSIELDSSFTYRPFLQTHFC